MSVTSLACVCTVLLLVTSAVIPGTLSFATPGKTQDADPAPDQPWPAALCLVPEMSFIPTLDTWPAVPDPLPTELARHENALQADWGNRIRPWIEQQITRESIIALSRWARPEMQQQFTGLPDFNNLTFTPMVHHPNTHKIEYRCTVSPPLPSHSPLVTRYLTVLCLYDTESQQIVSVTVTIRGEAQE